MNNLREIRRRLERGDTITTLAGHTLKPKERDMAKKKARRVAEAVAAEASGNTETDKYVDRLMGRLSKTGGLIQKSVPWLAIMDMIMKMIEACGSTNSARIVRRTSRPGWLLKIRMIRKIQSVQKQPMEFEDAASLATCINEEARANGKAMQRMIDEVRAPSEW